MSTSVAILPTVDCRALAAGERARAVLEAFDALAPGERFLVSCADVPEEILAALHDGRRGAFEWSPLREGPGAWVVEVERRGAAVGSRRDITEALVWDHRRLDALEEAAFDARTARRFGDAKETFDRYAHGLRRHIDFEEQLLFPEFEARSGIAGENGPTAVMRAEHRAMSAILVIMEREIADPEAPVEFSRLALHQIHRDHELKEEQVLYPAIDRLLTEEESDRMVARIQGWRRG